MTLNGTPKWTTWTKMQLNAFLCFTLSNVLALINLSCHCVQGLHPSPARIFWCYLTFESHFQSDSNILMLVDIRVSLPIRPTSLKEFKKRALRIILGTDYISYANALDVCDVDRLSARREQHSLKFAQSLTNEAGLVSCSLRAEARHMVGNWRTTPNSSSPVLALIDMLVVQSNIMWNWSTANSHNWTSCFMKSNCGSLLLINST